MKSGFEHM